MTNVEDVNVRSEGLSLAPFRAVRYTAGDDTLGELLSPPYDVISEADRVALVERNPANAVRLILPGADEAALAGGDPYAGAATLLDVWIDDATVAVDAEPALFVYEMQTADGARTRGLIGALELRDPADGVILPHENTMAGPVSDRLALMTATQANLEPIYLVYDGGGAASQLVESASGRAPRMQAGTPDGVTHRLWVVSDPAVHAEVAEDLTGRRAMIADGHHRYATYRQLQADQGGKPGPWDRGLTLLVDTSTYGPQVHPIHRVVALDWEDLLALTAQGATLSEIMPLDQVERTLDGVEGFAVGVTNGVDAAVVSQIAPGVIARGLGSDADTALGRLDVTILHRVLVEHVWGLPDDVHAVGYAHNLADAIAAATERGGTAVLLRPTPVRAVAEVAAAGARMPRKSTLFTPKPASGLVLRRFADQP